MVEITLTDAGEVMSDRIVEKRRRSNPASPPTHGARGRAGPDALTTTRGPLERRPPVTVVGVGGAAPSLVRLRNGHAARTWHQIRLRTWQMVVQTLVYNVKCARRSEPKEKVD